MNLVRNLAILALFALFGQGANAATTQLPPGQICFTTVNGAVSSGSINMFQVGTSIPKATYKDSAQAALNTQPIQLDANGCAIIYGVGSYRQQLFDGPVVGGVTTGNLIFDQPTTDTSAYNAVFWAGTSGGTPNAITITDTGFNGTDGSVVQFVALATNTGSTTLNPSSFGNILVQKSTTAGPVSLSGGEIVQGNVISAVYSASANSFQLLNAVIQSASGATAPLCGATGLKITNSAGTPNTILTLTADQVVMQTAAGITINRSNVSLAAINISTGTTTSAANGMDGEAPGTSAWLNIWAIDNGAAPAGLVSTSATAPTLPSGYSYKCRLGAMRVDGSGNLLRTLQVGNRGHYVVTAASNTTTLPSISSSTSITFWTGTSVTSFVPATATIAWVAVFAEVSGGASAGVAANASYPASGNGGALWFALMNGANIVEQQSTVPVVFEAAQTIFLGSVGGTTAFLVSAEGWTDKVNAN